MSSRSNRNADSSNDDPMERLLHFIQSLAQRHWRHVLVILLAVIAVLLGYHSWRTQKHTELAKTWGALNQMPPVQSVMFQQNGQEQLNEIIDECKSLMDERWETDATPWVLLKLANAQIQADRLAPADKTLGRLNRDFPDHYATRISQPVHAGVKEDLEDYKQAARKYRDIAQENDSNKNRQEWLDIGRAWEFAGEKDSALSAYDTILDQDNESLDLAAFRHAMIKRTGDLLSQPPSPPERQQDEGEVAPDSTPPPIPSGETQDEVSPNPAQPEER